MGGLARKNKDVVWGGGDGEGTEGLVMGTVERGMFVERHVKCHM